MLIMFPLPLAYLLNWHIPRVGTSAQIPSELIDPFF